MMGFRGSKFELFRLQEWNISFFLSFFLFGRCAKCHHLQLAGGFDIFRADTFKWMGYLVLESCEPFIATFEDGGGSSN